MLGDLAVVDFEADEEFGDRIEFAVGVEGRADRGDGAQDGIADDLSTRSTDEVLVSLPDFSARGRLALAI